MDRWCAMTAQTTDTIVIGPFDRGVLLDAWLWADPKFYLRRAEEFERAKHRPGVDFPGRADVDTLRAQWKRCDETARALRARAELRDIDTFEHTLRAVS